MLYILTVNIIWLGRARLIGTKLFFSPERGNESMKEMWEIGPFVKTN